VEASHSHNGFYLLLYSLAIGSLTFTQRILSASLFTSYWKPHIHTTDSICFFIHSLLEASHSHNGLYLLLYSLAIGSLTFTQHILSASLFTSYWKPHIHTTDSICFFIH